MNEEDSERKGTQVDMGSVCLKSSKKRRCTCGRLARHRCLGWEQMQREVGPCQVGPSSGTSLKASNRGSDVALSPCRAPDTVPSALGTHLTCSLQ